MKPALALHRSLTFWAGLLVLLFLGSAWRDSYTRTTGLNTREYKLISTNRGLYTCRDTSRTLDPDFWWRTPAPHHDTARLFPPPFLVRPQPGFILPDEGFRTLRSFDRFLVNLLPPGSWTLYLPYWLLLLAHLLPWTALLLLRARRRLGKTPALPPSS